MALKFDKIGKWLSHLEARKASINTTNANKSTIAVDGFALGKGCELALACDLRITTEKAKFGLPETKIGFIPAGGTQRLATIIGPAKAKDLLYTSDFVDANEALKIRLVDKLVQSHYLKDEAR